jgi:hypothetical protein
MKFQSGESGNPNGRPKGTGHRQQIFDNLVLPRTEELINVAIKKALAGNDTMLRLFLERILPPRPHGEPINIELPMDITNKELLLTMGEKVLLAVANQGITPGQGKAILELVDTQNHLINLQKYEIEKREMGL